MASIKRAFVLNGDTSCFLSSSRSHLQTTASSLPPSQLFTLRFSSPPAGQNLHSSNLFFDLPSLFFHTAKMKFTLASVLALVAVASAATVETPDQAVDRREVRLMERQGANANRKLEAALIVNCPKRKGCPR